MEFLKELFNGGALTYEQLETAAKEKGFSVVNASGGAYVPKDQVDTLTSQLSAANKKLEGYDPEWKTKAETEQRKLEAMQFEFALLHGCFTVSKCTTFLHEKHGFSHRKPVFFGGDKRDRTADLLNAIQALSQLSYTPK